jgi:hypothetical protein
MSDLDEIKSPFLRKVLQRRGINDDQVTSLLIVERYQQQPDPTNSIVKLMLTAINRDMPLEAAIVRREVELGRALTDKEIEQEIREFQSNFQASCLGLDLSFSPRCPRRRISCEKPPASVDHGRSFSTSFSVSRSARRSLSDASLDLTQAHHPAKP